MLIDTAQTSGTTAPTTGLAARLRRLTLSNTTLAFADQCAVSGQAFLTLLLMGAFADLAQVGAFAVALSIIAIALAIQDAAITRPYTVQLHTPIGSVRRHLIASLRLSLVLAGLAFVAVFGFGIAIIAVGGLSDGQVVMALAVALPGALLREFGRRVSFAHERSIEAVLIDAPVVCLGLAGIVGLAVTGQLTATTGLIVLAATNFAAGLCWLVAKGLGRAGGKIPTAQVAASSWTMGRWLILYQLAMQAQSYTTHWLALLVLGASATGVYAACLSIVAFANPMLYGLFNIMIPKSARVFRQTGNHGVIRRALRDGAVLVGLMLGFCVLIALFGQKVMAALYPAAGDTRHLLIVIAVGSLMAAAGAPAAIALASANKAANLALVTCLTALINLAIILLLLPTGGLLGAAYGTLIAEFVGAAGRWIALYHAVGLRPTHSANIKTDLVRHA
ncbi:MAG: polysaccharide biosynthesis C-terminal domain-containing protein [Bradyrhizobium sp.]|uniref:polysaccharide biosynthesis C-terminal domain-containing protein n=1 Tax=Bradyrhizobium sp. TaxID=376 RepID=UPI00272FDD50|nr:polysaccharide biosynthesis C-terminal domain-containing protein [Bradyrhizobium sp.]MDP1866360.1 polysaccharide biosynthesis C-terminal domain-containing protein [Bradyrhizobium sp.]